MPEYFSRARNFKITGGNWSHIGGNQYNYYTTAVKAQSGLVFWGTDEEEAVFKQYHEVKQADVELHHPICSYKPEESQKGCDYEKKFFAGEIVRGNAQGSGLTIVGYEGSRAQEAWLEDFKRCTGFLSVDSARLLAISRSKIPLLIFARGLVPAAQFLAKIGYSGRVYFDTLSHQLGCELNDVWMDPQRGTLCHGPQGPVVEWRWNYLHFHGDNLNIPSSVELLQEDVFVRFLISLKSKEVDHAFGRALVRPHWLPDSTDLQLNQPTVLSSLTNTAIASAINRRYSGGGVDGAVLGDGKTRFTFNNPPTDISLWSSNPWESWLSQAWSIFHALGISLQDDLSQYKLIVPNINLKLSLSLSPSKSRRRRYWQRPIFLFICPLPSTPLQSCSTSSLHYWSFDEDGQLPLSADMCNHLGLPVALNLKVERCHVYSWSNDVYKMMRQYQVARGFDPNTADFAQFLGDPAYKAIQNANSDRFKEIEGKNSVYFRPSSPPTPYRSQTPDESNIDTDLTSYSDTDTDSDFGSILPDDNIDTHDYDDHRDTHNNSSNSNSDSSSFKNHGLSSPDMDDLCTRFAYLALV